MARVPGIRLIAAAMALSLSGHCLAADLTTAQAEALLQPVMTKDCGTYYTEQGEPDFADLEGKAICTYKPRVTRLVILSSTSAGAEYNRDRLFDNTLSVAWLKDYAKMEAHETPSLLFKTLKAHLDTWRAAGSLDHGPRPGQATFKLAATGWLIDQAPQ